MGNNARLHGGGFHHIAIKVRDFDATVRFYQEALGFEPRLAWGEGDTRAVMLDTGDGNYLEVFAGGSAEEKPAGAIIHMAFRTEDVDAAIASVRAHGAEITVEPKDVVIQGDPPTPVRLAFCKGLDGEVIEFFQSTGDNKL